MPDAGLGNNGQRYEPGPDIFLRHAGISDKYVLGSHIRTCSVLNGTSLGFQFKLQKNLNNLLPMLHERRQWKRIELEAGNTPKVARHCQGSGCSRGTMHWMQWIPVRDAVLQNVKMWIALIARNRETWVGQVWSQQSDANPTLMLSNEKTSLLVRFWKWN